MITSDGFFLFNIVKLRGIRVSLLISPSYGASILAYTLTFSVSFFQYHLLLCLSAIWKGEISILSLSALLITFVINELYATTSLAERIIPPDPSNLITSSNEGTYSNRFNAAGVVSRLYPCSFSNCFFSILLADQAARPDSTNVPPITINGIAITGKAS